MNLPSTWVRVLEKRIEPVLKSISFHESANNSPLRTPQYKLEDEKAHNHAESSCLHISKNCFISSFFQ